jgi:radical SAM superfamily enzyme YgiQ (UPF0313 family)
MGKRILLGAEYSILDPLALFYLSDVAKQEGWEPKIVLSKGPEYVEFKKAITDFKPNVFGATIYTGNHENIKRLFGEIKRGDEKIVTVAGGPHPTYFPEEVSRYSDFVVMGEGFNGLRRILNGGVAPGIVHVVKSESFPSSDRKDFYGENPAHGENSIKNIVTGTGCFFNCTHCYNSNDIGEVEGVTDEQIKDMERALGSRRFFPTKQRLVSEVIEEIESLQMVSPSTKMLFLEDDIFGGNIGWLEEFSEKYNARLPFHANMRFELIDPDKKTGRKRVNLLKKSGCTGLSLAIESGDEVIRKEVLNRNTPEDLIFNVFGYLSKEGFKARTYQMLGLPYGATIKKTKVNLEADLETLELNVRLREKTGLPTITWAATLAPYPGTKIAKYCSDHGFYNAHSNGIIGGETYRIRSVLRHPRKWVGPSLSGNGDFWMEEREQEGYKTQLKLLMDYFPVFGLIPDGHKVAKDFLEKGNLEFGNVYALMKRRGVFDRIPRGNELEAKLKNYVDGVGPDRNGLIRYHMYDHDLFKID